MLMARGASLVMVTWRGAANPLAHPPGMEGERAHDERCKSSVCSLSACGSREGSAPSCEGYPDRRARRRDATRGKRARLLGPRCHAQTPHGPPHCHAQTCRPPAISCSHPPALRTCRAGAGFHSGPLESIITGVLSAVRSSPPPATAAGRAATRCAPPPASPAPPCVAPARGTPPPPGVRAPPR